MEQYMIIINRLILFILLFGVSHAAIILDSKLQAVNNTNFAIISNRNDLEITFPRFYIQDTQEVKLINYTTYRTYNILDTKNYANFSIKIGYLL